MKKLTLAFLVLLGDCGLDDIDLSLPVVWISRTGGTITVHNDSASSLDLSNWKIVEKLSSDITYSVPSGTSILASGTRSSSESQLGFVGTCLSKPTIFLYNSNGILIDDCSCL